MESHGQLDLLAAEQGCHEGLLAWGIFITCQDAWTAWLPPLGTTIIGTVHPLKGQIAGGNTQAVAQQPAGENMFSNGLTITKHKPNTKWSIPNTPLGHSHRVMSSLLLKLSRNPKPKSSPSDLALICSIFSAKGQNPTGKSMWREKKPIHDDGTTESEQ